MIADGQTNGARASEQARPADVDLRNVSWGYRKLFADTIEALRAEGSIGPGRQKATETFLDLFRQSRPGLFDHALKEFLGALNARTKWLLAMPALFEDFCQLGRELADEKLSHAIAFFRLWGQGGLGRTPGELRALLEHARGLRAVDGELAQAFLAGYGRLREHLNGHEVNLFVQRLGELHARQPRTAVEFAALRLRSARTYIRNLTQEARLDELAGRLERLARALSGRGLRFENWGELDSDDLIERNSTVLCFRDAIYFPVTIRQFASRRRNEALYLLGTLASAAAMETDSFCAIHGAPGRATAAQWLGDDQRRAALLTIIEAVRVLTHLREHMPGTRRLIEFGVEQEFAHRPPRSATDRLLADCLAGQWRDELRRGIRDVAATATGCADTAERMAPLERAFARAADAPVRALSFFPDFGFWAQPSPAPPPAAVVCGEAARVREADEATRRAKPAEQETAEEDEDGRRRPVTADYVYPEWHHLQGDYLEDWCLLREHRPEGEDAAAAGPDDDEEVRRARRLFERLKPELARKEKYLAHGDEIDIDELVQFRALQRRLPAPRVRFYQKQFMQRRDLAVALLLDVSGSTGNAPEGGGGQAGRRVIDLEKRAALILGEGLAAIGDAFAVYGFSGNGRESCDFFRYKDLDEPFEAPARRRLLAAQPTAFTRMGVAIRHCRSKLADWPARTKLLLLITDGKPEDSGYDPTGGYAQHDVRKACEECLRSDVKVVCISTLQNSRADLETMFPHRRYVILEDMSRLAAVLPALYLKMTT